MHHRFLRSALAGFALCSTLSAQTWIAPGTPATPADWNDPANWDTATVPNNAAAVVVINQVSPYYRAYPDGPYSPWSTATAPVAGGALPVITGAITAGEIRFDLPPANYTNLAALNLGVAGTASTGSLELDGAGFTFISPGQASAHVNVSAGSLLTLKNYARLTGGNYGTLQLYLSDTSGTTANPAVLRLQDSAAIATAGAPVTITSYGPAAIVFMDRARAGNARFALGVNNTVEFHNTASAESATFNLSSGSLVLFDGDSTAATSLINFGPPFYVANTSIVRFAGSSTAGQSRITASNYQYGAVEFAEQATAGSATINARRLDISGAVAAGGATGRTRATSSTLAPTSVVAADARTITLGQINVYDLILGSNTLEVTSGGWAINVRDSGGAYVSAAGENLVGGNLLINNPTNSYFFLYGPTYNPADPTHPSYNTLSGLTTVRRGNLYLYSNRLADLTVESGGIFGSSGGIIDGQLLNQGRVSPQTSILQVNGNFVQTSTGIYAPSFAYTPGYPTTFGLAITGNATLAGTLAVGTHPNMFARWAPGVVELQLLSAAAISGRFDTLDLTGNPARIRITPTYSATTLKVRFEMLPFAALGSTPGAQAFGAYLDRVYQYTGSLYPNNYNWVGDSLTFASDPVKVAQAMDNFAPDRYGSLLEHGFTTALARRSALDRAVGGNAVAANPARSAIFAEGGRRRLDYEAVDGLPRATASTDSWLAGGRWVRGAWTAGVYVAREKTDVLLDDAGSTAQIDSTEPGAFVRFTRGNSFVHASVGVSRDRYELDRIVNYPHFSNLVAHRTAAPDGQRTDWSLTAGHTWRGRNWSLTPFAGAVLSRWRLDDFTETTSLAYPKDRMVIEGWSRDSRRARAGVELAGAAWNGRLQPHLTATWWRELEEDRSIPTRFDGEPTGYLAPGRPADKNTVQAALGVDVRLSKHAVVTLNAALQHGDFSRSSSDFTAGFRWEF